MSKKFVMPVGITIAGVGIIALLFAAKPTPEPRPPEDEPGPVKVSALPAQPQTMSLTVQAQGTVTPKREIDLVAQVSGQVVRVEPMFVDGGFFDSSQVLLQIDDRDYRAAVVNAKSQMAAADQRLAEEQGLSRQARREWRDLGNESANELFLRKPQLAAAQANLEAAKAALATAELNLERTRISVPFPGRVRNTQVNLGQFVTAGTPLATVYDSTVVEVRLPLTEQQAALIALPFISSQVSQQAIERPQVVISGSVAGTNQQWQGTLTRTDAFVDANSRMYYAVVEVEDPFASSPPLLPGLFVDAEIEGKQLHNVLQLPRSALFERDSLLTLDGDNRIVNHNIDVLHRTDSHVWISTDIAPGTLVSLGKQSLTPVGSVVEPVVLQPVQSPSETREDAAANVVEPLRTSAGSEGEE